MHHIDLHNNTHEGIILISNTLLSFSSCISLLTIVMTSVYGVTYIGAKKQIHEKIEEKVRIAPFFIAVKLSLHFSA